MLAYNIPDEDGAEDCNDGLLLLVQDGNPVHNILPEHKKKAMGVRANKKRGIS
jgi:hypothetical protein